DNIQTQPDTLVPRRIAGTLEGLSQPRHFRRRNADTAILHAEIEQHSPIIALDTPADTKLDGTVAGELASIGQQVDQYLAQPPEVGIDQQRQVVGQQARKMIVVALGEKVTHLLDLPQEAEQVTRCHQQFHLLQLATGKLQQLVDQLQLQPRVLFDMPGMFLVGTLYPPGAVEDALHRGAQVVADARQQVVLRRQGVTQLAGAHGDSVFEPFPFSLLQLVDIQQRALFPLAPPLHLTDQGVHQQECIWQHGHRIPAVLVSRHLPQLQHEAPLYYYLQCQQRGEQVAEPVIAQPKVVPVPGHQQHEQGRHTTDRPAQGIVQPHPAQPNLSQSVQHQQGLPAADQVTAPARKPAYLQQQAQIADHRHTHGGAQQDDQITVQPRRIRPQMDKAITSTQGDVQYIQ